MMKVDGRLQGVSWETALEAVAARLKQTGADKTALVAGGMADAEALVAYKDLLGGRNVFIGDNVPATGRDGEARVRASYLFNSRIIGVEEADVILLVGTNPRYEAPLVNSRIRKAYVQTEPRIGVVGDVGTLNYGAESLGTTASVLKDLASGKGAFADVLSKAKRPMIIVGTAGLQGRADAAAVMALAQKIALRCTSADKDWQPFNVLHSQASTVAALDLGYTPAADTHLAAIKPNLLFMYGADDERVSRATLPKDCFVVYQVSSNNDSGATTTPQTY